MLKYPDEWAFVSLYDGLGGPPIFCGLLVDQRRVDRAVCISLTSKLIDIEVMSSAQCTAIPKAHTFLIIGLCNLLRVYQLNIGRPPYATQYFLVLDFILFILHFIFIF
jgi:hypothetical protein